MPDCPQCAIPLTKVRADTRGVVWGWCAECHRPVLVSPEGTIVYRSPD